MPPAAHSTNPMVVDHLALVGYQVNAMLARVPSSVARNDLASAGALALVRAARSYDASTGVPFASYASLRIRGALLDELRGMDWVSRRARQRARRMAGVADQLTGSLGRAPSRTELAEALGVAVTELDVTRGDADVRVLSLDSNEGALADVIVEAGMGPEEALLAGERLRYLHAGVSSLPARLRQVIEQLFFEDRTAADIAEELGVTQSRVSQMRTEALALLRDGLNASLDPALVASTDRPGGVADRRRRQYFEQVAERALITAPADARSLTEVPAQRTAAAALSRH
jgi:RNA polymerase sigma factor for flagellar operon FliA